MYLPSRPPTGVFAESFTQGGHTLPRRAIRRRGRDANHTSHGQSPSRVSEVISDEGVEIHPAEDVWGKGDQRCGRRPHSEKGWRQGAQAIVSGPAGENRVALRHHSETTIYRCARQDGHEGVLGSKKVKGIVFHGKTPTTGAYPGES